MATIDRAEQHYLQRLDAREVPEHLHAGIIAYLTAGVPPGGYLRAVLSNDLTEAVKRADASGREGGLIALVMFLFHDAPHPAWGSPKAVSDWMATFRKERV